MPLGEIRRKVLTHEEAVRLSYLQLLRYPQELNIVRHLSRRDFRNWLYMLNPRDALLFANSAEGHAAIHRQQTKRWKHEVYDWAWRKLHGNC